MAKEVACYISDILDTLDTLDALDTLDTLFTVATWDALDTCALCRLFISYYTGWFHEEICLHKVNLTERRIVHATI